MTLLEAALTYHRQGLRVIPVKPRDKFPAHKYKHIALITEEMIRGWWQENPNYNIGIVMGNEYIAFDIDFYHGHQEGEFTKGCTAIVESGSGRGCHAIWKKNPETTIKGAFDGIITRTGNTIVVAPPSIHETGGEYKWRVGTSYKDASPLPDTLIRMWCGRDASQRTLSRHDQACRLALKLKQQGKDPFEITRLLEVWNAALPDPIPEKRVVEEHEFEEIAKWVMSVQEMSFQTLRESFLKLNQQSLARVTDREQWRRWNGGYWTSCGESEFKSVIIECVDFVRDATRSYKFPTFLAGQLQCWAPGLSQCHRVDNDFDTQKVVLNCKNVTWSPDGSYPPRRDDLITRYINVNYVPTILKDFASSQWGKFLTKTCTREGVVDTELLNYLQLAAGYSVFGGNELRIIFFVYGPSNTGKSTYLEALRGVMGDYAHVMSSRTLIRGGWMADGSANTPDIAALKGKRLVISSEMPEHVKLEEERLKLLTGDDTITAMAKYEKPIVFKPEATMWLAMNDLPTFTYEDVAIRNRIKVVPFTRVCPTEEINPDLKETFKTDDFEREMILAWLLEGAQNYYSSKIHALPEPTCVKQVTQGYFEHQNPIQRWFSACCVINADGRVANMDRVQSIVNWGKETNTDVHELVQGRAVGDYLRQRGFIPDTNNRWTGFSLLQVKNGY